VVIPQVLTGQQNFPAPIPVEAGAPVSHLPTERSITCASGSGASPDAPPRTSPPVQDRSRGHPWHGLVQVGPVSSGGPLPA